MTAPYRDVRRCRVVSSSARPGRSTIAGSETPTEDPRAAQPDRRCQRGRPPIREELIALQGSIVKGKVVRLEEYGAFVEVTTEDGGLVTGLVHVSEVDADFVENIYAYLAEGDEVDVKILDVKEDGKVDLSIKRADPDWQDEETPNLRSKLDKDFNKRLRRFMHKSQMIQGEARRQRRGRTGA
ncbi:MAG: S1 RNA-binding domain-containing protein [Nitriliruptor sp.]|nr:MAG: S1 RNA-binding domain-containing protein [Nitriliruptor sp.]